MKIHATWLFAAIVTTSAAQTVTDTRDAILATCYDNIDGQLEGNSERVARTMHPEMVSRAIDTSPGHKPLSLEAESREEVIRATREGKLKLPKSQWERKCTILDVGDNSASVRLETPTFVSFDHLGNFDGKWLIVNSFWYYKPKPAKP